MNNSIAKYFRPILLLLAMLSTGAEAGETSLIVNGKSFHLNSSHDWNEENIGAGLEYQFTQKSAWKKTLMVNAFRDSTENMSYMAGAGLHRRLFESSGPSGFSIYAGLNAFLMTREDLDSNEIFPGVLPSLSVGTRRFGLNLTYLPRQAVESITQAEIVDPTISGIIFLQFKFGLHPAGQ